MHPVRIGAGVRRLYYYKRRLATTTTRAAVYPGTEGKKAVVGYERHDYFICLL